MTDPGPSQPASPDELAAVYLRGRDVPCAACGYNRRDGTTAACPECGDVLDLSPGRVPTGATINRRRANVMGVVLTAASCLAAVKYAHLTWLFQEGVFDRLANSGTPSRSAFTYLVFSVLGLTGSLPAIYYSIRMCKWRRRRNQSSTTSGRYLVRAVLWLIIPTLPFEMYRIYFSVLI